MVLFGLLNLYDISKTIYEVGENTYNTEFHG